MGEFPFRSINQYLTYIQRYKYICKSKNYLIYVLLMVENGKSELKDLIFFLFEENFLLENFIFSWYAAKLLKKHAVASKTSNFSKKNKKCNVENVNGLEKDTSLVYVTKREEKKFFFGASYEACKNLMSSFELFLFITLPYIIIAPSSVVCLTLYASHLII